MENLKEENIRGIVTRLKELGYLVDGNQIEIERYQKLYDKTHKSKYIAKAFQLRRKNDIILRKIGQYKKIKEKFENE